MKTFAVLFAIFSLISAHGILVCPKPRDGMGNAPGEKLKPTPPPAAALNDCEGTSPGPITATYQAGSKIDIWWDNTIPHPSAPGVRIAVSMGPGRPFTVLAPFGTNIGPAGCNKYTVTLPNTTSNTAILQWIWDSTVDGGYYLGCADIAITSAPAPTDTCTCNKPGSSDGDRVAAGVFFIVASIFALF